MNNTVYSQPESTVPDRLLPGGWKKYHVYLGIPREVTAIHILLATYRKLVKGVLNVRICVGGRETAYRLNAAGIADNEYVRFDLEPPAHGDHILVSLFPEYAGEDILAVWSGCKGPCISVAVAATEAAPLTNGAKISILVPCYNTPNDFLEDAIRSVIHQTYQNWELVLVDDRSDKLHVRDTIAAFAEQDAERIKPVYRPYNGGISEALSSGLDIAAGDWFCVLDHDDTLAPPALDIIARAIVAHPDAGMVYSDEDKILSWGGGAMIFGEAFRKPDWSPTLLHGQMYTCHLTAYRTNPLRWNKEFDGSQDYEYTLRYLRAYPALEVVHIPEILYHWRKHPASTATSMSIKPEAAINAKRAIREDLVATGFADALVTSSPYQGVYWVDRRPRFHQQDMVSIIIPSKDKVSLLKNCLESIANSSYRGISRVVIVDNGSTRPETLRYYDTLGCRYHFPVRVVHRPMPFNFSKMVNIGVAESYDDNLLLLNNDTEVITPDWLERMLQLRAPDVGAIGPMLLYADGNIQHAGVRVGQGGVAGHCDAGVPYSTPGYFCRIQLEREVECVTGACLLTTRNAFACVGGFEEKLPEAFNDVDYCLKLRRAGYRILYTPHAKLYHFESVSRGSDAGKPSFAVACDYMASTWGTSTYRDPYTRMET